MSTNAGTWFYAEPEHQAYLITERLNGTFWQARVVSIYWRCVKDEPPFRAEGYAGDRVLELEWVPGEWLALKVPADFDATSLVEAISGRILLMPAALTFETPEGQRVYEWHTDGGEERWREIQGNPTFIHPRRLQVGQRVR
ncbi:MAG TPA: hypothetical protein ENI95_03405 [Chloroflexi bacterium]|nr:hypothetical protein [Chloroflexota bacterium]